MSQDQILVPKHQRCRWPPWVSEHYRYSSGLRNLFGSFELTGSPTNFHKDQNDFSYCDTQCQWQISLTPLILWAVEPLDAWMISDEPSRFAYSIHFIGKILIVETCLLDATSRSGRVDFENCGCAIYKLSQEHCLTFEKHHLLKIFRRVAVNMFRTTRESAATLVPRCA